MENVKYQRKEGVQLFINKELELEKKSFALNLKILEEEKRILELQLKNLTK